MKPLLLLLAACAGKGQPCITITAPADGATIPTCMNVTVAVENLSVVSPVEHSEEVDGEGHWNIVINAEPKNFPCESLECSITLDGYDDGPISIEADLVSNTGVALIDTASYTLAGDGGVCP